MLQDGGCECRVVGQHRSLGLEDDLFMPVEDGVSMETARCGFDCLTLNTTTTTDTCPLLIRRCCLGPAWVC